MIRFAPIASEEIEKFLLEENGLAGADAGFEYEQRLEVLESLIRDAWGLALGRPHETIVNGDVLGKLKDIAEEMKSKQAAPWLSQIEKLRARARSQYQPARRQRRALHLNGRRHIDQPVITRQIPEMAARNSIDRPESRV